jgi:hypothetical protein
VPATLGWIQALGSSADKTVVIEIIMKGQIQEPTMHHNFADTRDCAYYEKACVEENIPAPSSAQNVTPVLEMFSWPKWGVWHQRSIEGLFPSSPAEDDPHNEEENEDRQQRLQHSR